jgi:hypothetical protein
MESKQRYCIIDIEIENSMTKENWDNKKAIPMLCGAMLIENSEIQAIVQLPRTKDMTKEQFSSNIKQLLSSLDNANYKLYALNAAFETESIEAYTGQRYLFHEIRGNLKGFLSSKDNLWQFLRKSLKLPEIEDVLHGNSALCPQYYGFYLTTHEHKFLQDIISHNLNCLLKEFYILLNMDTINKYAVTDNNGFITEWGEQNAIDNNGQ